MQYSTVLQTKHMLMSTEIKAAVGAIVFGIVARLIIDDML